MSSQKLILVADDSITIQKVIRLALSSENYLIEVASKGSEASQFLNQKTPDVVLIDVNLPEKDAFILKQEFDQSNPFSQTQFIIMSSAFERVDEAQYDRLGFHGRLTKPFDPKHLRAILSSALTAASLAPAVTSQPSYSPTEPQNEDIQLEPSFSFEEALNLPTDQDDMKSLTESTLKMSGVNEFVDSIEAAAPDSVSLNEWQIDEPFKRSTRPAAKETSERSLFPHLPPPPQQQASERPKGLPLPPPPIEGFNSAISSEPTVDTELVERIVKQRLETLVKAEIRQTLDKTIERLSREVISDVAESIIKQEIQRLLND